MEKIEILLDKLDNMIPSSLAKRLDSLEDLHEKLEVAGEEYEQNPTDENRASYNEVIEYVDGIEQGIVKDLQALLEKKKAEQLAKEQKANEPAKETEKESAPTPSANPTTEEKDKKEEKKGGSGVLTLVIGGALLVASFGAINFFRKR
jgi:glutamyl/glutaminyl-tRNA synthetase